MLLQFLMGVALLILSGVFLRQGIDEYRARYYNQPRRLMMLLAPLLVSVLCLVFGAIFLIKGVVNLVQYVPIDKVI